MYELGANMTAVEGGKALIYPLAVGAEPADFPIEDAAVKIDRD